MSRNLTFCQVLKLNLDATLELCDIITFMKVIDWTHLYTKYKGKWVALKDDEVTVISSGNTLDEVAEKAEKKGFKNPIFYSVPKKQTYFVGKLSK